MYAQCSFKGGRINDPLLSGRSVPDGPLDALDDPLESILRLFKSLAEASRVSPVGPTARWPSPKNSLKRSFLKLVL